MKSLKITIKIILLFYIFAIPFTLLISALMLKFEFVGRLLSFPTFITVFTFAFILSKFIEDEKV